jgi:hypothetical protein
MRKSGLLFQVVMLSLLSSIAAAKTATCSSDIDPVPYACDFKFDGGNGSFVVRSPRHDGLRVEVGKDGSAEVSDDLGTRWNPRMGKSYQRDPKDRACWREIGGDSFVCAH